MTDDKRLELAAHIMARIIPALLSAPAVNPELAAKRLGPAAANIAVAALMWAEKGIEKWEK